jgi:hypothetical protein
MPPFPTQPAGEDWFYAARAIQRPIPSPFGRSYVGGQILFLDRLDTQPSEVHHDDPLGRLVAVARDRMRTRHTLTPAYHAFLGSEEAKRRAAAAAEEAERARRHAAKTAREHAEEAAFYADGGTALEWSIRQEATQQAQADAAKKRATSRMRAKARTTPRRKGAPSTTKETT